MEIEVIDENGKKLNIKSLNFYEGALHKVGLNKYIYKYYTEAELAQIKIQKNKKLLAETDYKAIKYAEGELTEEEYAPIREQRRAWRQEINEYEDMLA